MIVLTICTKDGSTIELSRRGGNSAFIDAVSTEEDKAKELVEEIMIPFDNLANQIQKKLEV